MKKILYSSILLVVLLALAGCLRPVNDEGTDGIFDIIITEPGDGATVSSSVTIKVNVGKDVAMVKMYVDGTEICETRSYPFSCVYNFSASASGNHTIKAESYRESWESSDILENSDTITVRKP